MPTQTLVDVVHFGMTNGGKSMFVIVPKKIREKLSLEKGRPVAVSIEGKNRIIYDLLEEEF